jgi:trypsin-like peptidase
MGPNYDNGWKEYKQLFLADRAANQHNFEQVFAKLDQIEQALAQHSALGSAMKWIFGLGLPAVVTLVLNVLFKRLAPVLLLAAVPALVACAELPPPDTTKIISVSGRFALAHVCPIGPDVAVTAAHVVDPSPLNPQVSVYPLRGSNFEGSWILSPWRVYQHEDIALVSPIVGGTFPNYYHLASAPPSIGEKLYWLGFDWREKGKAFARRVFSGEVLRLVASLIILDTKTDPGSSGSCILNQAGEVVGVISFGKEMDDAKEITGGVGVWKGQIDITRPKE